MTMVSWRKFTRFDWLAFAGANPFPDGRGPVIAEWTVPHGPFGEYGGLFATAVAGGGYEQGHAVVQVDVMREDGETLLSIAFYGDDAQRAMLQLDTGMTLQQLRAMPGAVDALDGFVDTGFVDDGSSTAGFCAY